MLNEAQTYEKREAKVYPLLHNDIYQVQLVDVNEEENKKYQSEEVEKVLTFEFAILMGRDVDGNDVRTRLLAKNFVPTYLYVSPKSGKNWLYKIVEALIGRDLTAAEEANGITGKTLNFLIGKQCRVLLEKVASKKDATKFYSKIANILPASGDMTPLTSEELQKMQESKKEHQEAKTEITSEEELPVIDVDEEEIRVEDIPF